MPPRRANRKQVSPALSPATAETAQTSQVRRSGSPRCAAPSEDTEENFDLANISGGEGEEDQHPAQPLIDTETTTPEVDSGVNNPDIVVAAKNQADDVAYFYDKLIDGYECKICRYEFLHY
jgi:hypothetical protein